jgi:ubiquinone biosynthesis monooxygenase Coq7
MTQRKVGELTPREKIEQIIRVNQAGEYGAIQIYKGQLKVFKNPEIRDTIEHMLKQEEAHLHHFNQQLIQRKVRPTVLSPLWHLAGFALGAATALMGKKVAMACTVAVEEVIDEHYQSQEQYLSHVENEEELKKLVSQCRQEEIEHRDIGYQNEAEKALAYPLLTQGIKRASKLAIWLSKRI